MKVLITGATGFIGARLAEALKQRGDSVQALSRNPEGAKKRVPALQEAYAWEPLSGLPPSEAFRDIDAVVHLAGETVVGRWTSAKKTAIRDSRTLGTRNLVSRIAELSARPRIMVSASAIGYYGDRGEEELSEESTPGGDFLGLTCQGWEQEARKVESLGVRLARVRIGVVLGAGGGALDAMLMPFKLGVGGPLGSGRQWWSWIHIDDLVRLFLYLIDGEHAGVFNGTAPAPTRQKDFARVMGKVLGRPAFMPAPAFALKIVLGGFATELLSSSKVLPVATQGARFEFHHPELESALRDILRG
jgi:uncharacterized protein (TIGR01777 family)